MAEQFVRWTPELSIVSLRFSNVYTPEDYAQVPAIQARPASRRANLWAYVDAEDCGEACRLAAEAQLTGHHRLIIAAADNVTGQDTRALMAEHYPATPLAEDLVGDASLLSSARAEATIGYRPRHSWRTRLAQPA
jgi:nucleoside-diphosphate-sugar epimerase